MRTFTVTHFELTKSEHRRAKELAEMALLPYQEVVNDPTENKVFNMLTLGGERVWAENSVTTLLVTISKVMGHIGGRIHELSQDLPNVPENSSGLIARPQDMYKNMISNYQAQLRNLDELTKMFLLPTIDEEDEYKS